MSPNRKKTVLVHLLLLTSTLIPHSYGQQGFVSPQQGFFPQGAAVQQASTFHQTTNAVYPANFYSAFPAAKGYYPASAMNSYYYPIDAQYWLGQQKYLPQYPTYPQHQQYGTWQYPVQYYPQQYGGQYMYYPQPYGYYHQQTGYDNVYGQYPGFDANYWTGNYNYHPMKMAPYMNQVPVYHAPVYYTGHPAMYNGQYPYHPMPYPIYPHPHPHYDRGFFGGTGGGLAKGLLGALVVGTLAGAVVRKG